MHLAVIHSKVAFLSEPAPATVEELEEFSPFYNKVAMEMNGSSNGASSRNAGSDPGRRNAFLTMDEVDNWIETNERETYLKSVVEGDRHLLTGDL